jgi:hypothetical protein
LIITCIAVLGTALILGRWHNQERTKNRIAGKPVYMDYLNLPSIIIYILLIGLVILRIYISRTGGISLR